MPITSVLVSAAGATGLAVAMALAQRGVEVTLVGDPGGRPADAGGRDADPRLDAVLVALGVESGPEGDPAVDPARTALARARRMGVAVRGQVTLVGLVAVDGYLEAELSDGRVENHDLILSEVPSSSGIHAVTLTDADRREDSVDAVDLAEGLIDGADLDDLLARG
jgi:NADPH-dependent 2,4-dienoyl-CoA reductase/sulfur reductase-like enzyme